LTVIEWKPFRHEVRAQWRQLTDMQPDAIAGLRAHLAEQIRVSYGITVDEAERQTTVNPGDARRCVCWRTDPIVHSL
jgi:hypothetical protein